MQLARAGTVAVCVGFMLAAFSTVSAQAPAAVPADVGTIDAIVRASYEK